MYVSPDQVRKRFALALKALYENELPPFRRLVKLVNEVNAQTLMRQSPNGALADAEAVSQFGDIQHGAIRLGSGAELAQVSRLFALMGMEPVDYYDLSAARLPVHSTAFRPVEQKALEECPLRIFTSVLRVGIIEPKSLRDRVIAALNKRQIFSQSLLKLIEKAEQDGGLKQELADELIERAVDVFRWRGQTAVSRDAYESMRCAHGLIADVAAFATPHINHLTPRTLNISEVHSNMSAFELQAKQEIEGPPARSCAILLRQTAFRAMGETIRFADSSKDDLTGVHHARFGEVEQRGAALTPLGRQQYDLLLQKSQHIAQQGANYQEALQLCFKDFPDTYQALHEHSLAFHRYSLNPDAHISANIPVTWKQLIAEGLIQYQTIQYEDFLPISAAGIFHSNLQQQNEGLAMSPGMQTELEEALGKPILKSSRLYALEEHRSVEQCKQRLQCQHGIQLR